MTAAAATQKPPCVNTPFTPSREGVAFNAIPPHATLRTQVVQNSASGEERGKCSMKARESRSTPRRSSATYPGRPSAPCSSTCSSTATVCQSSLVFPASRLSPMMCGLRLAADAVNATAGGNPLANSGTFRAKLTATPSFGAVSQNPFMVRSVESMKGPKV